MKSKDHEKLSKDIEYKADFQIDTVRHSTAHLMAAAIKDLYPDVQFGVGPALENGFYYDIKLPFPLTKKHLSEIEKNMKKLKKSKIPYVREEMNIDAAITLMEEEKQPFKVELLRLLKEKGSTAVADEVDDEGVVDSNSNTGLNIVSLYRTGDFIDLCRGPHVNHTGQTGHFLLNDNISAAFWRGNAQNESLQRIYGICYLTKSEVVTEKRRLEEAKKYDHRTIGTKHSLFFFRPNEIGKGLPLWPVEGTAIRKELEAWAQECERRMGYKPISTPEIAREELYHQSGHLPYYAGEMYQSIEIEGDKYRLRPMNCPHHHMVYQHKPRSYKELPMKLSEYGKVYRYEKSGALTGLMRTRGFTQNDAHIYCTKEQAKDVFLEVMHLHAQYYEKLHIKDFYMRLSLPDTSKSTKYATDPEEWNKAVEIIRDAMKASGLPYKEVTGEAAFYGPKVDFQIKSALGVEFTISTNQLDFLASKKFNLTYKGKDGKNHPIYVIHRAPLGSHERFVAFLTEHFKGVFPTWLAPVQVKVVPVSDKYLEYAKVVREYLFNAKVATGTSGLRVELDDTDNTLSKKIRTAQQEKIPYIIVLGEKENNSSTVSVRLRSNTTLYEIKVDNFIKRIQYEVEHHLDLSYQENPLIEEEEKLTFEQYHHQANIPVDIEEDPLHAESTKVVHK